MLARRCDLNHYSALFSESQRDMCSTVRPIIKSQIVIIGEPLSEERAHSEKWNNLRS